MSFALFLLPLFLNKAWTPIAVFWFPTESVGNNPSKALEPTAVFKAPVVLLQSEPAPNDVLFEPVVV